jgi:hypothetical protein
LERLIEQHARVPPQAAKPEVAILGDGRRFEHPFLIRRTRAHVAWLVRAAPLVRCAHIVVILTRILSSVD